MEIQAQRFGIEIEFTGITRETAAHVAAGYFGTEARHDGTYYDVFSAPDGGGRKWKFVSDSSIEAQTTLGHRIISADSDYKTELVSPICRYEDIPVIQDLVRKLRGAGAFSNDSCGIHVHVDASAFDAGSLRNLTNIMAAKEDLIYKALQVQVEREHYCQRTDPHWLETLNRKKPKTAEEVSRIWYDCHQDSGHDSDNHYHHSRYHCLNLHSVFTKGTVEFRLFNSEIRHAGKIKAYIQLALAVTAQALNQTGASHTRTESSNEKYTFRTWLLRLGMIGDEFKTARTHLLEHLDGCIAWKDPAQALAQKERLRQKREKAMRETAASAACAAGISAQRDAVQAAPRSDGPDTVRDEAAEQEETPGVSLRMSM